MMLCPVDQTQLAISNRQGIEIDYCPACRGVWLDRGELDKLVERESQFSNGYNDRRYDDRSHYNRDENRREDHHDDRRHYDGDDDHGHHKKHKKEGLLGDLFDFG